MEPERVDNENVEEFEEDDQYINEEEVYLEVQDDGDHPMEGDEEYADGDMGDEIVYEDNSIQHFPNHGKSVFAVATHPHAPIAASGGEDDLGYIWDYTSGDEIVKLTGHTDSVTSVGFSADGELIATGGMDGKARVWRRRGKDDYKTWEFLTELQGPDEITWIKWHPKGTVLLAGGNDGTVWLWQLPSGNTMQVFAGHTASVSCGEWTPDGKRIITADEEGNVMFWDPRNSSPVFKLMGTDARFDIGPVTAVAVNPASTLAVVGGTSGGVRVVSLSKGDIVGALGGHKEDDSVEAIIFVDLAGAGQVGTGGVCVTAATDGKACIWDLSTMRLRATMEHDDAITTLQNFPHPKSHLILSASADRSLKTWDARTGTLVREHKGHHGPVLAAALGHQGQVVVSAGDDGVCLVFAAE